MLTKPTKLQRGDKVATVSPSWGGAGDLDLKWRYEQGVKRLETVFGLEVIPMPNSLKGSDFLYQHPQLRAADLMTAFKDEEIKGIFANIGGEDSIRLLPYIDYDVIRANPKVFMGYSDVTISHLFCYKAGLASFYGPAILTDFAENVAMDPYTVDMVKRALFSNEVIGEIQPAQKWTSEFIEWSEDNKDQQRSMRPNSGYEVIQGVGIVQGRLLGGCIDVLEFVKGTELWPSSDHWDDAIIFFETSEEQIKPEMLKYWLRNYAAQGIFQKAKGILFAKPYDEKYDKEYKAVVKQVTREYDLENLAILYNLNFGHTEPKFVLPYGAMAEINCNKKTFSILESGVK